MDEKKPQRSANRFLAGLPCVVHGPGGDVPCRAHDLSRNGTLLVSEAPLPEGGELELTLKSGGGDLELTTPAKVARRTEDVEDGSHQVAVQFPELKEDERATLEALVARVVEGIAPAALQGLPQNPTPQQIRMALDQTPLTHRINLAQRGMPREREWLVHDPNPQVIDALAHNPNLVYNEVRALLRLPTLLPSTLESLGRDPRWRGNPELKILIASHHSAPFALADRLAAEMPPDAVRKLVQQPGLNSGLRTKLVKKHRL